MPRFCPSCFSEFTDEYTICPQDEQILVVKKPEVEALVDLYAAVDILDAERIVELFLDEGILAHEITEGISQMPVSNEIRFIISVKKDAFPKAKILIEQAQVDGVISKDGSFL